MAQRISMVSGVCPGAGLRRPEIRRPGPARSQGPGLARDRDRRGRKRHRPGERQPAHREPRRAPPGLHRPGQRPAHRRRGLPPADRGLPQRLPGAPGGARPGHRQRGERQGRRLVQPTPGPSSWPSSASRAPTRWRWWTPSESCCPPSAPSCRPRSTLNILYDRSRSIRDSVDDVKFTLLLTICPGRPGDLPLPAEPLRHHHPQPGPAHVHRGHLRGHVSAGLQPGQPLPHGPDPLRGLRGGRRHRHAGEHRAPHGDGETAFEAALDGSRRSASPSSP